MARPKLPEGAEKTVRLTISLNPVELVLLQGTAKHHKIYISEAVRRLIHQGVKAGLAIFNNVR